MIELFQGDLVSFSKEEIDISLVWFELVGLHGRVKGGHLYLFCREDQV